MNLKGGGLQQVQTIGTSILLLGKQNNNRAGSCYPFSIWKDRKVDLHSFHSVFLPCQWQEPITPAAVPPPQWAHCYCLPTKLADRFENDYWGDICMFIIYIKPYITQKEKNKNKKRLDAFAKASLLLGCISMLHKSGDVACLSSAENTCLSSASTCQPAAKCLNTGDRCTTHATGEPWISK